MGTTDSFKPAVCNEYERLLFICEYALETWKSRRDEISNSGMQGKEVADELLRLQADYAKAYSRLERHRDNCEICRVISKIAGRNYSHVSNIALDRKHVA
jgi:hypothetical protein